MPIWTEGDRVEVGWGEAADSSNKTRLVVGVCGGRGHWRIVWTTLEWSGRSLEGSRWDEKGDGAEEGAVAWGWRGREAGLVPKGSGWVRWVGVWGGVGGGGGGGGVGVVVGVGVATGLWVKPDVGHDSAEMRRPDQEHRTLSY